MLCGECFLLLCYGAVIGREFLLKRSVIESTGLWAWLSNVWFLDWNLVAHTSMWTVCQHIYSNVGQRAIVNENWLVVLNQWELILNVAEFLAWGSFLVNGFEADYWFVNWKKFHNESNKAKLITMKIVLKYRRNLKRREVLYQLVRVNENWFWM
jgi:hypothetical protein